MDLCFWGKVKGDKTYLISFNKFIFELVYIISKKILDRKKKFDYYIYKVAVKVLVTPETACVSIIPTDNTHRKDTPKLYLMFRIIAIKNEIVNKVLCFFCEMSFFIKKKIS